MDRPDRYRLPLFWPVMLAGLITLGVILAHPVTAETPVVGTLTVTSEPQGSGITKYTLTWTSDASGDVSANRFALIRGSFLSVKFIPGSGADQPTDQYDVTLVDLESIDYLDAAGSNLSNSTSTYSVYDPPVYQDNSETFDLVVANAGNAKSGTVIVWVQS